MSITGASAQAYTKAQADARFLNVTNSLSNSLQIGGTGSTIKVLRYGTSSLLYFGGAPGTLNTAQPLVAQKSWAQFSIPFGATMPDACRVIFNLRYESGASGAITQGTRVLSGNTSSFSINAGNEASTAVSVYVDWVAFTYT